MVYWGSATVLSLVLLMGERPEVAGRQSGLSRDRTIAPTLTARVTGHSSIAGKSAGTPLPLIPPSSRVSFLVAVVGRITVS